jgi:3-dehydroquinate dehydratase II
MPKKVLVINGPNLNMLGKREPGIYGSSGLEEINAELEFLAEKLEIKIQFVQSNHEGEIVDSIQKAGEKYDAVLINPAAFTHTSVAIRDAFLATDLKFVEIHISNVSKRDDFRKKSYLSDIAVGTIAGFGKNSYMLGLRALAEILQD